MECKETFDIQKTNPIAMLLGVYILSGVYFQVIDLVFVGLEIFVALI